MTPLVTEALTDARTTLMTVVGELESSFTVKAFGVGVDPSTGMFVAWVEYVPSSGVGTSRGEFGAATPGLAVLSCAQWCRSVARG